MSAIPEDSLEKLLYFRREMDRIFRDFFDPQRPEALRDGGHLDVQLDAFETEDEIVIEVELPGVDRENIELSVLRDVLIVEGVKHQNKRVEVNYHCMERSFGKFRRIIEIPGAGDTRNIQAKFDQGVLHVHLPRIRDRRGQQRTVPIG